VEFRSSHHGCRRISPSVVEHDPRATGKMNKMNNMNNMNISLVTALLVLLGP
jgi:hypothetical protein